MVGQWLGNSWAMTGNDLEAAVTTASVSSCPARAQLHNLFKHLCVSPRISAYLRASPRIIAYLHAPLRISAPMISAKRAAESPHGAVSVNASVDNRAKCVDSGAKCLDSGAKSVSIVVRRVSQWWGKECMIWGGECGSPPRRAERAAPPPAPGCGRTAYEHNSNSNRTSIEQRSNSNRIGWRRRAAGCGT